MQLGLLCLLGLLAGFANSKGVCGSSEPPEEAVNAARLLHGESLRLRGFPAPAERQLDEILVIPTYLHIVETEEDSGFVTEKMLSDQVSSTCKSPFSRL
jgi:hypothetical protein